MRSKIKKITIAILALIPATLLMANPQTQTALDKALEAATKNPEKESDYYNLFLTRTLQHNPEVSEAYLAQVHYVKEGEKPHLALVLRIDQPALRLEAIRKDLATAGRPFLNQNEFIDIFVDEGRSLLVSEVTKAVRPFYVRKTNR